MSSDHSSRWRAVKKRVAIALCALGVSVAVYILINAVNLTRQAVRSSPVAGSLASYELYGQFLADYTRQYPVSASNDGEQGAHVVNYYYDGESVVGEFIVRRDTYEELTNAAEVVFGSQKANNRQDDNIIILSYRRLVRARHAAIPVILPYVGSTDRMPHYCHEIYPVATNFSRCHRLIETKGQLAAILMSRVTEAEVTADDSSAEDSYHPLWMITAIDSDPVCSTHPRLQIGSRSLIGMEDGRNLYVEILSKLMNESALVTSKLNISNQDWVIVKAKL